jgi:hypothetical protein
MLTELPQYRPILIAAAQLIEAVRHNEGVDEKLRRFDAAMADYYKGRGDIHG